MLVAELNAVQKFTSLVFDKKGAKDLIRVLTEMLENGTDDSVQISDTFSEAYGEDGAPITLLDYPHSRSEQYQPAQMITLVLHQDYFDKLSGQKL